MIQYDARSVSVNERAAKEKIHHGLQ